jgi:hypothetical protein
LPPSPQSKDTNKTPKCIYSAVAGIRPPNPSLVVDLLHLKIVVEDQLWPEILYDAINKKLIAITPPLGKLVTVRWTAKGNLVVTGGTNATLHSL